MPATRKERKNGMSIKDLRSMTAKDLQNKLVENQEELMRARFSHALATLENTAELKLKRRQIARIETVLYEKGERV